MKISRKDSHLQGDKPEAEVNRPLSKNKVIRREFIDLSFDFMK